jgi:hypothetical protein
MAQCRERGVQLRWGARQCPECGVENPTGANPGDVALVSGLTLIATWLGWLFLQGRGLTHLLDRLGHFLRNLLTPCTGADVSRPTEDTRKLREAENAVHTKQSARTILSG